jgi:serine/threonine protein kinase
MFRPPRKAALLLAGVPLLAVAVGSRTVSARAERAARTEALRVAGQAARLAQLELEAHERELQARAAAAASLNPVRALAAQGVDERTLRDSFETEEWWSTFRDEFPVQMLLLGGERHDFGRVHLARAVRPEGLVREALKRSPASEIFQVGNAGWFGTAGIVDVPVHQSKRPVAVVLARPLENEDLVGAASRAGGAVALTGGDRRVLATAGPSEQLEALRALLVRPEAVTEDASRAAGQAAVGEGLQLWAYADTRGAAEAAHGPAQVLVAVLWIGGVLAAGALVWIGLSRPKDDRALLEVTRDELRKTRAELARLRTPVPEPARTPVPEAARTSVPEAAGEPVPPSPTVLGEPAPTPFGRYQLLHVLGQGGVATVHLAATYGAEGFRRFFVVKRLRKEVAQMPEVVYQFIHEARLCSGLVHPNIVPIFDFGRVGDEYFLAQEYILGRDLSVLVRRALHHDGQALPVPIVLHLGREILEALRYAHSRTDPAGAPLGIVHRDISPMNVMVTVRGEVKLLDFGLATSVRRLGSNTRMGTVKGNVLFMSPEQARGLETDARSDLFSLGLTLYHCLAGEPLYDQEGSEYDLLVRAARGPTELELSRIAALGAPIDDLLSRALRVSPGERFQTADEFLVALQASGLAHQSAALVALVQRLVGPDLATEEVRFAGLDRNQSSEPRPPSEQVATRVEFPTESPELTH